MSERKVKVSSMVKYPVCLTIRSMRFSKTFNSENQSSLIPYDVMEEGLQRPGFKGFFKNGTLKIEDKQDRIDLGLEDEDGESEVTVALDTKAIIDLLKGSDYKKIEDTLNNCSYDTIERCIQVAINSKIYDYKIIKLLEGAASKYGNNTKITRLLELAEEAEAE